MAIERQITMLLIVGIVAIPIIVVGNVILGKMAKAHTKSTQSATGYASAPTKIEKGLSSPGDANKGLKILLATKPIGTR